VIREVRRSSLDAGYTGVSKSGLQAITKEAPSRSRTCPRKYTVEAAREVRHKPRK